ncbi:phage tail tape measure protein [Anaerotignum sp.]|uniref:phage tail tape measure protein n=1 Tax=Anaerotignum sp. TaxID=2039241 RepID=UPI00289BCB26|nr:phage tail tape measure protein [Anaerotignum sp.]
MASIKGITIQIGADTKGFKSGLAELNKSTKNLQNELKSVDKALKLDPTNTDLIRQKQGLLKDAIGETETKIKALKAAKEKADNEMKSGTEINQEEYRRLQREITFAETALDNLQEQAKTSNIVKGVLGDAKEGFEDFAKKAAIVTVGVGAVATGLGACAKKADELKQSYNTLQTQTGATDEEMDGLEQSLKNIYANNFGENFEDIAAAMAEVKNQTGLAGDELEAMTENAIALRDIFGYEVQESTRAADMMMKQFGITSEEAFNLIAQGSQNGLDKNGNLLDSINEYSVHFEQLGFTAEDMFNVFHDGAMEGVFDIDKVGDAFKEFGIRVKDGSDSTNEAFGILGLNAQEMQDKFSQGGESAQEAYWKVTEALNSIDDPVQRNIAGVNLFGTMWEDVGDKAILGAMEMSDYFNGTVETMNQLKEIKYDDLSSAFEGIGRQLETGLVIPIGEEVLPKLNEFANYIQENMPQIQETFQGIMDGISAAISFVVENLDIIIPILAGAVAGFVAFNVINTILPLFTAIRTAIAGTTTVQAALNAVMAANPFGLIVTAIAALVAAGVALYMNWDTVKQKCEALFKKISEVWNNIKTTVSTIVSGMVTTVMDKVKKFIDIGKNIVEGLWDGISNSAKWLLDKVKEWCGSILNGVKAFFGIHSPSRVFKEIGKYLVQGLGDGINENGHIAVDEFTKLCDNILDTADEISTGILSVDEKTGEIIADRMYKNVMDRIELYYKDRDKRISLMDEASDENIKMLERDVRATEKATDAKIKLYQQEYRAKVRLLDDETSGQVKALQDELDAIDEAEEERRRKKEEQEYKDELKSLTSQLPAAEGDEKDTINEKIDKLKLKRAETLRKQELADKKDAIREEIETVREQAEEKKKQLEEELKEKEYILQQQRKAEIEYMQTVIQLMQEQVDKKTELEKIQTEIKEKEAKLQTEKADTESKSQTKNELDQLKARETDLQNSLKTNEEKLRGFTPTLLEISTGYGDVFLEGFKSTEGGIMSYVNDLCEGIREKIRNAMGEDSDGSHRTGLSYVPFDGYRAILHRGEKVLTQPEADRYRKNEVKGSSSNVTNNFYGVKEEETAFKAYRATKKAIRETGLKPQST